MILFDTNVLIDLWHQPKRLLELNITPDKFSICGVVRSELLHGAKNEEISGMLQFFQAFNNIPMDEYDWEGVGFMLQHLRSHGYRVPLPDAIIAFTAIKYDVPLWTNDKHFKTLQAFYPELKLHEETEVCAGE